MLDRTVDPPEVAHTLESHSDVVTARIHARPGEFYDNPVDLDQTVDGKSRLSVSQIIDDLRSRPAFYKRPKSYRFVRS